MKQNIQLCIYGVLINLYKNVIFKPCRRVLACACQEVGTRVWMCVCLSALQAMRNNSHEMNLNNRLYKLCCFIIRYLLIDRIGRHGLSNEACHQKEAKVMLW